MERRKIDYQIQIDDIGLIESIVSYTEYTTRGCSVKEWASIFNKIEQYIFEAHQWDISNLHILIDSNLDKQYYMILSGQRMETNEELLRRQSESPEEEKERRNKFLREEMERIQKELDEMF